MCVCEQADARLKTDGRTDKISLDLFSTFDFRRETGYGTVMANDGRCCQKRQCCNDIHLIIHTFRYHTTHMSADAAITTLPVVARDPRFRAGRTCMQQGKAEQAVSIFATLLQEARQKFGDDHVETIPAYYEYGNALFRSLQQQEQVSPESTTDIQQEAEAEAVGDRKPSAREAAAAAAERRAAGAAAASQTLPPPTPEASVSIKTKESSTQQKGDVAESEVAKKPSDEESSSSSENDGSDIQLALEMMETAWSILDQYRENSSNVDKYKAWVKEQTPRILTGIGDILSAINRHADSTDAYCRALAHRQVDLAEYTNQATDDDDTKKTAEQYSLSFLKCRRLLVETNVLIAEELLACPPDKDVVTTESGDMLVSAAERVEYARGYYDRAREELQETVLLMGELAAKQIALGEEKENVCFAATLVMGVGTSLAEIDEQEENTAEKPPAKKQKKV